MAKLPALIIRHKDLRAMGACASQRHVFVRKFGYELRLKTRQEGLR